MAARRSSQPRVDDTASWRPQPGRRTSLLFDVFVLGQRTRTLVNEAMHDAGLRPDEYAAYSVVFEMQPVTLTEMADQLAMPLTTVAEYVQAMTERGHLRKRPDPDDQRARLLTLTPAGIGAPARVPLCSSAPTERCSGSSDRSTSTPYARFCSSSRRAPRGRSAPSRHAVSDSRSSTFAPA